MADLKPFRFGPIALTSTLTPDLLSPTAASGGTNAGSAAQFIELHHLSVLNKDTVARTLSLWLGGSAGNVAGTEVIASGMSIGAGQSHEWYGQIKIDSGQYLVGGASANTALTIMGEGVVGLTPLNLAVAISDQAPAHANIGGTATAGYKLLNTGVAQKTLVGGGGAYTNITGEWLIAGSAADFEAKMTYVSGDTLTNNPLAAWASLGSDRTCSLVTTGNDETAVYTLEIRRVLDSVVIDTATITFNTFTV
jgi:hypothetical protein